MNKRTNNRGEEVVPILRPGESVTLRMKLRVVDIEAMEKRGDKWYHFFRPILYRDATPKELKRLKEL